MSETNTERHRKLLYSVAEAAELLSLSKPNIRKFINAGALRSFKVGARRLISREAIDEFRINLEQAGYTKIPRDNH